MLKTAQQLLLSVDGDSFTNLQFHKLNHNNAFTVMSSSISNMIHQNGMRITAPHKLLAVVSFVLVLTTIAGLSHKSF